jgi:hypothetical protein
MKPTKVLVLMLTFESFFCDLLACWLSQYKWTQRSALQLCLRRFKIIQNRSPGQLTDCSLQKEMLVHISKLFEFFLMFQIVKAVVKLKSKL